MDAAPGPRTRKSMDNSNERETASGRQNRIEQYAVSILKSYRVRKLHRSRTLRMSRVAIDELLEKLDPKQKGLQMRVNDVFKLFQDSGMGLDIHCWCDEPLLFLKTAALLLMKGEPVMADFVLYRAKKDLVLDKGKISVSLMNQINLLHAKALCGMNSLDSAIEILEELYSRHSIRTEELLGLYGRCHKDSAAGERIVQGNKPSIEAVDTPGQSHLDKALRYYQESFEISQRRSTYTGINAASMALLGDHEDMAVALAEEVQQLCQAETCEDPVSLYWNHATWGECAVIKRDWQAALHHYSIGIYGLDYASADQEARRIYCQKNIELSWLMGTRKQFRLLLAHIRTHASNDNESKFSESDAKDIAESIDSLFSIPNVMAMLCKQAADLLPNTSHLTAAQRTNFVKQLHQKIEDNNIGFAYCSAFPGVDITFAEAVLESERHVDLYLVLPIPADSFRELVVRGFDGESWGARLDKVLAGASNVVVSNDMSKDVTDVNLQYNYSVMTGMAVAKANVNQTQLHLCYCDPSGAGGGESGDVEVTVPENMTLSKSAPESDTIQVQSLKPDAQLEDAHTDTPGVVHDRLSLEEQIDAYIAQHGRNWFGDPQVIRQHNTEASPKHVRWETISIPPDTRAGQIKDKWLLPGAELVQTLSPSSSRGTPQVIKAVLFADVKGFSKLSEHEVFFFTKHVFGAAADLIKRTPPADQPIARNTWGDAFYFVFNNVRAGGIFSLSLRDLFNCTKWEDHNLPPDLAIRISMHAAPVFHMTDSVLEKEIFTGVHTSRGARIEPITPPGSVYCSRAFAAMSDADTINEESPVYACPFIGNVPLAKSYGMLPVHVIRWVQKPKVDVVYYPQPEKKLCWQQMPTHCFNTE